jgi:hypothetical protein
MRGFCVTLSNGLVLNEETIKDTLALYVEEWQMQDVRPWIFLREFVKRCGLKVVSLELKFDHQSVFLPRNSKVYFYSIKVEAYLGGTNSQLLYYGVGASDRSPDEVEITWYDGRNSQIERRKVDSESCAYIIN